MLAEIAAVGKKLFSRFSRNANVWFKLKPQRPIVCHFYGVSCPCHEPKQIKAHHGIRQYNSQSRISRTPYPQLGRHTVTGA